MNTLLKMLEADGYRRLMSTNPVVPQLMPAPPEADELDRGLQIVSYRFCQTLDDLKGKLKSGARKPLRVGDQRPVFAYSLSPGYSHLTHQKETGSGWGIVSRLLCPVAAQVEEIDACLGRFVEFLKETGLYDQSVIVIMSDHGDSLGEGTRWGHSYTMFQEVVRIPLIVHVPGRFREGLVPDVDAVSLSTDLTPTLYALAGHPPRDLGPLYGRPLFEPSDGDHSARRQGPRFIASSYGAVYAVLRDNGKRLFIADGVNNRDYACELGPISATRVGITTPEREENRRFIRQQIGDIGRRYRFEPQQ